MIGAKVNGEIKPLNYRLRTGDFVWKLLLRRRIMAPAGIGGISSKARKRKARSANGSKECRDENIERGKEIVEREIKKQGFKHEQIFKPEWLEPS